jgi:hypothetical protein
MSLPAQRVVEEPKIGFRKPSLRVEVQPVVVKSESAPTQQTVPLLKKLVWAYFWLLIFEGALRKWIVPQFNAPLLVVRDPIVLAIYYIAAKQKLFPMHQLSRFFLFQVGAGVVLAAAQFALLGLPLFVIAYGYRTLYLHIPLIFLLPEILDYRDLIRIGRWVLIISVPMAVLMGYQFRSPIDAWINRTVGVNGGFQIASALGKIRPPGTFSFISGPVAFYALVTSFLGYGLVSRAKPYSKVLLTASMVGVGLAVAVSGSRATILSGAIVILAWVVGVAAGKRVSTAVTNSLIVIVVAIFVLGHIDLVDEGKEVLNERIEIAGDWESQHGGIGGRFLHELLNPIFSIPDLPFFGVGLGVGTNVGANILTGQSQFLAAEGEWGRNLVEMGALFGLLFIGFRVYLTGWMAKVSIASAQAGHILPLLLFSACAVNLLSGQISQPTTLGFTVFVAGLCLVAIRQLADRVEEKAPAK